MGKGKGKKVDHDYRDCCERWAYRGGYAERLPPRPGFRSNWQWMCCGASGYEPNKAGCYMKIDTLLAEAGRILAAEGRIDNTTSSR